MQAMVERDAKYTLCGNVQADDAYLGGELAGGKAGRGSREQGIFCGSHLAQTHQIQVVLMCHVRV